MLKRTAILTALLLCVLRSVSAAGTVDKVVAFVDTDAITLSEIDEAYALMRQMNPEATRLGVLDAMINRLLLLREARRLRLENVDEDKLLEEYIDIKVRSFVKVRESDIQEFYESNREEFKDKPYKEVKSDIELYLLEKEVNFRIKQHLATLKEKAYIKILIDEP